MEELYAIVVFEVVVVWKEVTLILRTVYIHTAPRHTFGRDAVGGSRTVPRGPTTLDQNLELSIVHQRTICACMGDILSSFLSSKDTSGHWMRNVTHQESLRTLARWSATVQQHPFSLHSAVCISLSFCWTSSQQILSAFKLEAQHRDTYHGPYGDLTAPNNARSTDPLGARTASRTNASRGRLGPRPPLAKKICMHNRHITVSMNLDLWTT